MTSSWFIKVSGDVANVYRNNQLLAKSNGEKYGRLVEVSTSYYGSTKLIKLDFDLDGKTQSCMVKAKNFRPLSGDDIFRDCKSVDPEALAKELQDRLCRVAGRGGARSSAEVAQDDIGRTENKTSVSCSSSSADPINITDTSQSSPSLDRQEGTSQNLPNKSLKRKRFSTAAADDKTKNVSGDGMQSIQESCDECLVTTTSQLIPISQLCLPIRPSRQFRRVNRQFVEQLSEVLLKEPGGSHGSLFVVAKGITAKEEYNIEKKDTYFYEVLGGTHLMLATKKLHEQFPENKYYKGRMSRIYCGLTDDQAIHLGAMHQNSTSYCHNVTYREEVERCRSQLYDSEEQNCEPPQPSMTWRDTCARILYKDKRSLSEIFTMAQMSKSAWEAFVKVNDLYESGKLKDQKCSQSEIAKGTLALKKWHMKPLVSLPDNSKVYLLNKLVSGEVLLKELQTEAAKIKSLHTVQSAVMSFFHIDNWDQATERFGSAVDAEKLVRFTGNFEPSHDFQVFLRRLKDRENQEIEEPGVADADEFTSTDGNTKGYVIFRRSLDHFDLQKELSQSSFGGAFLTFGLVGFDFMNQISDERQQCNEVIDLVRRLNFLLLSSFNCIILCPVNLAHSVKEIFTTKEATLVQHGYIHHKKATSNRQGIMMQEVVSAFVVGHWAISRIVGSRHVNYLQPPTNLLEATNTKIGEQYPVALYEELVKMFSKEHEVVIEVGHEAAEVGNAFLAALNNGRRALLLSTSVDNRRTILNEISSAMNG